MFDGFPMCFWMVFLLFSYGVRMVFLWLLNDFPMVLMVFLCLFNGLPMVSRMNFNGAPNRLQWFSHCVFIGVALCSHSCSMFSFRYLFNSIQQCSMVFLCLCNIFNCFPIEFMGFSFIVFSFAFHCFFYSCSMVYPIVVQFDSIVSNSFLIFAQCFQLYFYGCPVVFAWLSYCVSVGV